MRGPLGLGLAICALVGCVPAAAQQPYLDPTPPWPQLLPARPSDDSTQPGPQPGCDEPSPDCVERAAARMTAYSTRYGCDHRAVFATTYRVVTQKVREALDDPGFFEDRGWLILEDALFADYYFRALEANEAGQPVPEAWRIAFDTAASGDANAAQDMLLGINSHVQRDMPFVLAEVGMRKPDGSTRKPDHDVMNKVLERSYEPIVREIAARYDPIVSTTNSSAWPVDDVAGLEIVAEWREAVWRNAERLLAAGTPQERAAVAQQIEDNATAWARMIAGFPQQPGYREKRDSSCALQAQRAAKRRRARLSATARCTRNVVRAGVAGDGIRKVAFKLDGRRKKTDRRADARGRFRVAWGARGLRRGHHRVTAQVTFGDGETRILRRNVNICARR